MTKLSLPEFDDLPIFYERNLPGRVYSNVIGYTLITTERGHVVVIIADIDAVQHKILPDTAFEKSFPWNTKQIIFPWDAWRNDMVQIPISFEATPLNQDLLNEAKKVGEIRLSGIMHGR